MAEHQLERNEVRISVTWTSEANQDLEEHTHNHILKCNHVSAHKK
jgi:hypothetical protein